jgi:Phytanoyl-CoA dioxygenase (PhyH)
MLTAAQHAEFEERGFVRIPGAFSREQAAAMESRVWGWLERTYALSRTDPATWKGLAPTGLQGLKRQAVFDAIGSDATCAALDALLGPGGWKRPRDWGGFLVNFPSAGPWRVPSRVWHTDFAFQAPHDRVFGALVLSFLSDVPPGAGGTTVVEGSHRVIRRFLEAHPRAAQSKMKNVRLALCASDPWLKALTSDAEDPGRDERLRHGAVVSGVRVRVAEVAGEAGDLVIGHPWLLHAGAPNCGSAPRIMRVQRVRAS